jgi:hypothetical protein
MSEMTARSASACGSAGPFVAVLALFVTVGAGLYSGWIWSPSLPSLPAPSYRLTLPDAPVAPSVAEAVPQRPSPTVVAPRTADWLEPLGESRPLAMGQIVLVPSSPAQTSAPAAPGAEMRIGNTGGVGAFIRRTPRLTDRLVAWPDATILQALGETAEGDGVLWINVRDPSGNLGWIPAGYVLP